LRWIEVDFPAILDYKEQILAGEAPRCRRERLSVDLTDPAQRRALFDAAGPEPALMITEGLLQYLPAATVEALAQQSAAGSGVAHWIADITTSAFSKVLGGANTMNSLRHVQATDHLQGEQILDLAQRHGWATAARRSYITDTGFAADRVRRMMGGQTPPPLPIPPGDLTGVHRFAR
jgi:O-methyltransferase involved in polyketide biosynthesis